MKGKGWLEDFDFADLQSLETAKNAISVPRPAAFLIIGESQSGKTRLARLLIEKATDLDVIGSLSGDVLKAPRTEIFSRAVNYGYLFIDNVREFPSAGSEQLEAFITSREFSYRPFRKTELVTIVNRALVVIAANPDVKIPPDLLRRCHVIRLEVPQEMAAAK